MSRAREQLARLAAPPFARLLGRVRERLEREPDALPTARVTLRHPTDEERAAIGGLLGTRPGKAISVALADLDAALRAGPAAVDLVGLLERLGGPLRDRTAERDAEEGAIALALARARRLDEPWFEAWLDELRAGPLTRMAREGDLERLDAAVTVLEALPAEDVPIALFASRHAGGTKALDDTPLDRLVLHALALRAGVPRPERAEDRRALWERFGVVPDDLAAQVLVLNLPAAGDGLVDRVLRDAAAHGVPMRLTLHQLVRHPPRFDAATVYVCENPAVVRRAAEVLGAGCAPLVATEGRPSAAFWRLGRALAGSARVVAHADFDAAGLEIAGTVIERLGAAPWRFGAEDFRRGVASSERDNAALPARLPPTPWDPELCVAMRGGRRLEEEEVLDDLLADLASRPGS